MRIPLASGSVDAATVAFGIRNVERPEDAFADVFRVLRPGGRFAILEFGVPRLPGVRQAYLALLPPRAAEDRLARVRSCVGVHVPAGVGGVVPGAGQVMATLAATGFSHVKADPLTLGVVYLYSALKPDQR